GPTRARRGDSRGRPRALVQRRVPRDELFPSIGIDVTRMSRGGAHSDEAQACHDVPAREANMNGNTRTARRQLLVRWIVASEEEKAPPRQPPVPPPQQPVPRNPHTEAPEPVWREPQMPVPAPAAPI